LAGWWLYSALLGGAEEASREIKRDPARGWLGILFFSFITLVVLCVAGLIFGQ
jgi:hypothetical protein